MTKLRIICREDDARMAVNVGGPVQTLFKAFEVDAPPEAAAWICAQTDPYVVRTFIGVEAIAAAREEPNP